MTAKLLLDLFDSIATNPGCPTDIRAPLATVRPNALPIPQLTWTAFALIRYRRRRLWACAVVHDRLKAQVRRVAEGEDHLSGIVPGLPDWEYHLAQSCSRITHRGSGERLFISLLDDPEDMLELDFSDYLMYHREPGPLGERLGDLFPGRAGLDLSLDALARSKIIRRRMVDISFRLRVRPKLIGFTEPVERFLGRWSVPEERLRLAVQIGDWPAALEMAEDLGDTALIAQIAPLAEQCRRRWLKRLRTWVDDGILQAEDLVALSHATAEELPKYLESGLVDPLVVDEAIQIIEDEPSWCPKVFRLLTRKRRPERGQDRLEMNRAYATYLTRHGYRRQEVFDTLLAMRSAPLDVLIVLALEGWHDRLLSLLRRGLRSSDYYSQLTAAAVLALYDTHWSRQELMAYLNETSEWDATSSCLQALLTSRDTTARRMAQYWELERPKREEDWCEECFGRVVPGEALFCRMEELADLVARNRDFVPAANDAG